MLAYIGVNGAGLPAAPALAAAVANPDTYNSVISGQTLTVSDPAKGVIANDVMFTASRLSGAHRLAPHPQCERHIHLLWRADRSFTLLRQRRDFGSGVRDGDIGRGAA